ncbi:hypothetical protein [uncultured Mucilaginibacter sp.]|uniref:hypothetical protein n=1 Tax=uncultured Mucilaginibacter sp. TaxID=797541 RepID=UPI0025E65B72|nr:hypothetical protein [uncultured Mucilaginibacter sp.]
MDKIRIGLLNGDKTDLLKIAPYLDSTRKLTEYLGYHILETEERQIAQRLIIENCIFLNTEIVIDNKITAKSFFTFYKQNEKRIGFSVDAGAFLIAPLKDRSVNFEIQELSETDKNNLKENENVLLNLPWVKKNHIEQLINSKNPYALFKIAAELFKGRNRFDNYQSDAKNYIDLLDLLTGTETGVKNEHQKITLHIDKDYDPASRLNLLIYFAKNYPFYKWNETTGRFENDNIKVEPIEQERVYFQLLSSKVDSVALNAFLKLTTGDVLRVQRLADEYENADMDHNYVLPIFPFRFLKQMVALTDYCKSNHIDFKGGPDVLDNCDRLNSKLSFPQRYQLENKLINTLSLNNITAYEYWFLVYEQSNDLSYSAGRILDAFYSKNWSKIVNDKKQSDLYLKKSILFERLGIIGICNNYLNKFINADSATLNMLKQNVSSDQDINFQMAKAIKLGERIQPFKIASKKYNGGNYDTIVNDFEKKLPELMHLKIDSSDRDEKVSTLLSQINYNQVGVALKLIENYSFKWNDSKYTFMDRDFGFFNCDFNDPVIRGDFLDYYNKHTEAEVYAHYLDKAKIVYKNAYQSLNYDKIYEMLKFDTANAFVGGGGATRDNEVYLLIKLLELNFKTTLGFPCKLCNSANMNGCDSLDRAKEWRNYLKENKLLKLSHKEPMSFNYQDN